MNVTEIRIKLLVGQPDKLRGFASLTLDGEFVVRDLKIIDGPEGAFVAMPSRKMCDKCPDCGGKNHLRARFCNDCGHRLRDQRGVLDARGKLRLYADIAHPIHQQARTSLERSILEAYRVELVKSREAGYVAPRFDDLDYEHYEPGAPTEGSSSQRAAEA
jgi:stage V sporulation protein G